MPTYSRLEGIRHKLQQLVICACALSGKQRPSLVQSDHDTARVMCCGEVPILACFVSNRFCPEPMVCVPTIQSCGAGCWLPQAQRRKAWSCFKRATRNKEQGRVLLNAEEKQESKKRRVSNSKEENSGTRDKMGAGFADAIRYHDPCLAYQHSSVTGAKNSLLLATPVPLFHLHAYASTSLVPFEIMIEYLRCSGTLELSTLVV